MACPSTAHFTGVLAKAGVPITTSCPYIPQPLHGFLHHSCLFVHVLAWTGWASPWAYLSFWILQVEFCRPWSTRPTPASPSTLVRRLSSVRAGLAWIAELMSLHCTSVRPQSSSLQTGPLSQNGAGLSPNHQSHKTAGMTHPEPRNSNMDYNYNA